MTKLVELAKVLRSKNSGPFQITLDVLFDSRENYERVVRSGVINRENICRAYNLQDKDITEVVFFDSAMGIKVTTRS